jgi:hypothetical protein
MQNPPKFSMPEKWQKILSGDQGIFEAEFETYGVFAGLGKDGMDAPLGAVGPAPALPL